ncbi:MAG: MBL fold metallo-hydrolase [Eubacterium sp.]|nr:MBL fold metallo-hydrolase [Eubacterium sp.]
MKKLRGWMLAVGAVVLMATGLCVVSVNELARNENVASEVEENNDFTMEVHFIDVGQGDATLIESDGHYMLIDAGNNDKGTALQLYLQKQGVKKLDYLVLTHSDADHIGGADVIVTKFDVDNVFLGDFEKENKTYEDLIAALVYKDLTYSTPMVGSEYMLGNATFTIAAPNRTYEDANNSSIALVLTDGDNTFLFTGDCEEEAENDILASGVNIDCDVYKIGHHGSRTSSGKTFLEAVTPAYGVISCGVGNDYGHPHADPLNNLRSMGVQIFRTDEQGSIIAYSDGSEITWNCAPSDSWKVGEPAGNANTANSNMESGTENDLLQGDYVIANKKSGVFHKPTCNGLPKERNRLIFNSREEAIAAGYDNPCDYCEP